MNKALIKTILSGAKSLFVVSLIIYLVGFLLEITFPGFVSNNFNLNWLLGGVLLLGLIAAFAPDEQEQEEPPKPKKSDYWLFIGLGIVGGLLMFYKSDLDLVPRILFSVFVAGFIMAISLYLLLTKDEDSPEPESAEAAHLASANLIFPKIRQFMARPVKIPLGVVLIGLILLGLGLVKPRKQPQEAPPVIVDQQDQQQDSIALFLDQYKTELISQPSAQELKETPISVLNGSTQVGSASAMAKFLKTKDFTISRVADADSNDYENALIRFRPEEMKVAVYLVNSIQGIYPIVEKAPAATDSGGIILILGNL